MSRVVLAMLAALAVPAPAAAAAVCVEVYDNVGQLPHVEVCAPPEG